MPSRMMKWVLEPHVLARYAQDIIVEDVRFEAIRVLGTLTG